MLHEDRAQSAGDHHGKLALHLHQAHQRLVLRFGEELLEQRELCRVVQRVVEHAAEVDRRKLPQAIAAGEGADAGHQGGGAEAEELAAEHHRLARVHGINDVKFRETAVSDFTVGQGLRNHANRLAARLQHRIGNDAHQAHVAAAVDQTNAAARQQRAHGLSHLRIRRLLPDAGPTKHAHASHSQTLNNTAVAGFPVAFATASAYSATCCL